MTDDSVIEEAAKAMYFEDCGVAALGDDAEPFREMARAAFAVFEKAHAPTDADRDAIFEALADRLGEHSQVSNYEIADSGEYETMMRGPVDVEVLAEWLMPTVLGFRRSEVPEPNTAHQCENCQTCGVHDGRHDKCCGCYDGVCCQESVPERQGEPTAGNLDHYTDPDDPFWQSRPEPVPQGEPSDALNYLDEMNEQGRIEYDDYRNLHDLISGALEPAPELFPGTLDALEGLTIRKGQES